MKDAALMTIEERHREISAILALGILRHRQKPVDYIAAPEAECAQNG